MKNYIKLFAIVAITLFAGVCSLSSAKVAAESCLVTSVRASHILVDTKAEADALKARIDSGESFEAIASEYSKCPSSQRGGDLGYFGKGQMVSEFETAAFELPVGKVSAPIRTQFGWHLIKVLDKK